MNTYTSYEFSKGFIKKKYLYISVNLADNELNISQQIYAYELHSRQAKIGMNLP